MVLSCVCCVCSCLLYHKFQQWKRSVLAARNAAREAAEGPYGAGDLESLPSYTIVSGLPSYEEALEQLRLARERRESLKSQGGGGDQASSTPVTPTLPPPITPPAPAAVPSLPLSTQSPLKLSVAEFFQMYKSYPPPV